MICDWNSGDEVMALGGRAVTRVDLYDAVYRKVGLSRSGSAEFVERVLKEITYCIAGGETVKLSSFGTFTVRKKGQRMGRNPKTGLGVPIAPRRVVSFKASTIMKKQINIVQAVQRQRADWMRRPMSPFGRYCCKSLFVLPDANSKGRRRGFVKITGDSS